MGLDNGIKLKAKSSAGIKYLAENQHLYGDSSYEDMAYWRKCFNIRKRVLEAFANKGYDGQGGDIKLTSIEDLVNMAETLKYFLNESNWVSGNAFNDGSIWEWYVALPSVANAIRNLRMLIEDIEWGDVSIDDLNIYFYDSY